MELKKIDDLNNIFISETNLKDSIFTKDNIKYNILIKFPDGSTLKNYNDDQYPVIPFCLDEDSLKNDNNFQKLLKGENNEDIKQKLLCLIKNKNKDEKKENKDNKEPNKIIFNFPNKNIELNDKIFALNSKSDKNEIDNNIIKKNEENNENINIEFDIENNKEINSFDINNTDKESQKNKNNEKHSDPNNFNNSESSGIILNKDRENINNSMNNFENNQNLNYKNQIENQSCENQFISNNIPKENQKIDKIIESTINLEINNSSGQVNAFTQTSKEEKGTSNESENNEYFQSVFKNPNQILINENLNIKKVRRNKNYEKQLIVNKNKLVQEQELNKAKKEKKVEQDKNKKYLNKMLLEREMNEIKKKLEQKKKKNQDKISDKKNKLNNDNLKKLNVPKRTEVNIKLPPKKSIEKENTLEKFNIPSNNDICSKLLQSTLENEKQLLLVPYAKQKEKIKKTFNTIGKLNGISYSEYRIIKGIELDNKYIINIIRDDDKISIIKRRDVSETGSLRRSRYTNYNKNNDDNSEMKYSIEAY